MAFNHRTKTWPGPLCEHDLVCRFPQIVVAGHGGAICAGVADQEDISFACWRDVSGMTSSAGFTDRSDNVCQLAWFLVEARKVSDGMVGTVERGTNEGVHAGVGAYLNGLTLGLDLCHLRQEYSCVCDEKAAWFQPQLKLGMVLLERSQRVVYRIQLER
jgi:hypothetical protein